MVTNYCSVPRCKRNRHNSPGNSYFACPSKDKEIVKKWCKFLKVKSLTNKIHVCSDHFESDCFQRDLKSELLNLKPKRLLHENAIPTIFDSSKAISTKETPRMERAEKKKNHEIVEQLLLESEIKIELEEPETEEPLPNIEDLLSEVSSLKSELEREKAQNKELLELLKTKDHLEKCLSIFTQNQIDLLSGTKKRVNWTHKEFCEALTVKCLGIKAYEYMRDELHYPFPCRTTLNQWESKLSNTKIKKEDDDENSDIKE